MICYYDGLVFKNELEARWAAFFDLAGWSWWINPKVVGDWQPDFKVKFECSHSECGGHHTLLVAVLPLENIESFKGHPCMQYPYGVSDANADGGAAFGLSPIVTEWVISHGAGAGPENIDFRVEDAGRLWQQTAELVTRG